MKSKKLLTMFLAVLATLSFPLAACKGNGSGNNNDNPPEIVVPPEDNPLEDNPPEDNPPEDNPLEDNPPVDNPPVDNPPVDNPPDNPPQGDFPGFPGGPGGNQGGFPGGGNQNVTAPTALDISATQASVEVAGAIDFTAAKADTDKSGATAIDGGAISANGSYLVTGAATAIAIGKGLTVHLFLENAIIESEEGIAISSDKNCNITITVIGENSLKTTAKKTNALHVKGNLTINGSGTLTVVGTKSAIKVSKDLKVADATLNLEAKNHGIDAQSVAVKDAKITVTSAGKDGIHAECDYDEPKNIEDCVFTLDIGYVSLVNVEYTCKTKGDGIQADTFVYIDGGKYNITTKGEFVADTEENRTEYELVADDFRYIKSGNDYKKVASDYNSRGTTMYALAQGCKGIKVGEIDIDVNGDGSEIVEIFDNANYFILIKSGEFNVNSTDDAFHSNSGDLVIEGGTYVVNTYDDAFTADNLTRINGGTITIESSYEGIEGGYVEITGGTIKLTSSDDGINAASDDNKVKEHIIITGGDITVKASGDGVDSNGTILITGGKVVVCGSTSGGDGSLDADGGTLINGGTVFASTVLGMVETPSSSSKQYILSYANNSKVTAGTVVKLTDSSGNVLVTATVLNDCQSIIISAPSIALNGEYKLYASDNLLCTFNVTSIITSVGNTGSGFPGGKGPGGK